jgi:protein ImuB
MMDRTLCIWYPEWALRRSDAPQDDPCQIVGEDGLVVAVNQAAGSSGVRIGMRRSEAEGICPTVVSLDRDPGIEMAAFEAVVITVEDLVPRVEVVEPGLVMVPVAGAMAYYGGEGALVERVVAGLENLTGSGFRIGLAAGPFASREAAKQATGDPPVFVVEDDAAFLASLDVASVGREELVATFRWLGITTLGELAGLPRGAIVSRFGRDGLEAHRRAAGEDHVVVPRDLPPDLVVEERFSPPLNDMERAVFASSALANRLIGALAPHGIAPHRVRVEAEAADGTIRSRTWRSADPFDDTTLADRIRWQLRAWVEGAGAGIRGGLVAIRIEPADLSGEGRQLAIDEDARSAAETIRALSEVQAIVGPDGLLQASPQGGRDPGERVAWRRWGEEPSAPKRDPDAPWPGRLPAPSPSLVPPGPQPFPVEWDGGMPSRVRLGNRWEPVLSWAGPWRKMGRWWEGESPADRYQIVTSAGAFLCEVRENETWLTGIYD